MHPTRDDELINNPAFHQAVRSHRITITDATYTRSHRNPIGLVITAVAIGLIGLWIISQLVACGG